MKALIIYFSQFGNTRRVAEAIAETLAQAGEARAIGIDQFTAGDLNDVGLVVIGSPTHYQSVPKDLLSTLKKWPKRSLAGKSVAAFDTSLKMWGPIMRLTAAHRLLPRLRRLGGKRVVPAMTFHVKGSDRPSDGDVDLLCEGELERATVWGTKILSSLQRSTGLWMKGKQGLKKGQ